MEIEQESFRRFQERQARIHPGEQPAPWQEEEATGIWRLWRHGGAVATFVSPRLIQLIDASELMRGTEASPEERPREPEQQLSRFHQPLTFGEWRQQRAWERELATGVVEPPGETAMSSRSVDQEQEMMKTTEESPAEEEKHMEGEGKGKKRERDKEEEGDSFAADWEQEWPAPMKHPP